MFSFLLVKVSENISQFCTTPCISDEIPIKHTSKGCENVSRTFLYLLLFSEPWPFPSVCGQMHRKSAEAFTPTLTVLNKGVYTSNSISDLLFSKRSKKRQMAGESESSTVSIFCSAESELAGLAACQSNRPKRDKIWRWQLFLSPFPLLLCFSPCHSITCGQAEADLPLPPSLPLSVKLEGTTSVFIPCSGKTVTIDFCCFCL